MELVWWSTVTSPYEFLSALGMWSIFGKPYTWPTAVSTLFPLKDWFLICGREHFQGEMFTARFRTQLIHRIAQARQQRKPGLLSVNGPFLSLDAHKLFKECQQNHLAQERIFHQSHATRTRVMVRKSASISLADMLESSPMRCTDPGNLHGYLEKHWGFHSFNH